jgi:hypothetical protein
MIYIDKSSMPFTRHVLGLQVAVDDHIHMTVCNSQQHLMQKGFDLLAFHPHLSQTYFLRSLGKYSKMR